MSRCLVTLDPLALQFKQLLKQCADGTQFLVDSVEHLLDVAGFRQSYHDNLLCFLLVGHDHAGPGSAAR